MACEVSPVAIFFETIIVTLSRPFDSGFRTSLIEYFFAKSLIENQIKPFSAFAAFFRLLAFSSELDF